MTQILLGSRVKFLERSVGLDVIMRAHIMTTILTLSLLSVHFLNKNGNGGIAETLGLIAGITTVVVVFIAVFLWMNTPFSRLPIIRNIRKFLHTHLQYQQFRAIHNIMTLAGIAVGLHISVGSIAEEAPIALLIMRAYFLIVFLSFVFHKCIKPAILKKSAWEVVDIVKETGSSTGSSTGEATGNLIDRTIATVKNITTLKMSHKGKKAFRYYAGQFGFFQFITGALNTRGEEHPFSFSSSEQDEHLSITVQDDGDFSHRLQTECKVGDTLYVDGPYGKFYIKDNQQSDIIAIAGGVGITPYMGWLENMKRNPQNNYRCTLIWLRREENDTLAKHILSYNDCPNIEVKMFSSKNPLSDEYLLSLLGNLSGNLEVGTSETKTPPVSCYICASKPIVSMVQKQLLGLGVRRKNIRIELFAMG